jgi:uncharacterized SAM-binding protein YcdF (DUF218 family)
VNLEHLQAISQERGDRDSNLNKVICMYQIAKYLSDPYVVCSLGLGAALVVLWRRLPTDRRRSLRPVIAIYLLSLLLAIPATSFWPLRWIERNVAPLNGDLEGAQAIVVLGGGIFPSDSIRARPELTRSSSSRCLYALELYRTFGPLPIYVTGAKADPARHGPGESESMRDFLAELGVKPSDLRVDAKSSTTHENAVFTTRMLREAGIGRILLVTDALHMPRSIACFRKEGVELVPAVCSYRTTEFHWTLPMFLPSIQGLAGMSDASSEWLGYAWYSLTGKL